MNTTTTYFEALKHTAKTVAKEDPENAQFIGMDKSLEVLANTDTYCFTAIVRDGSKAAERVLKASYAFAADPEVETNVDTPTIENNSWRSIVYHYVSEKAEYYAVIMLTNREVQHEAN